MSANLRRHAFTNNPLRSQHPLPSNSTASALQSLTSIIAGQGTSQRTEFIKVLPFRKARPLARSLDPIADSPPVWRLNWIPPEDFIGLSSVDSFVYLGSLPAKDVDMVYWAIDVSVTPNFDLKGSAAGSSFVDLRTLMVATDWADEDTMAELAIAGHAKAMLEWHNTSRFCGHCGARMMPVDAGRRKQCTEEPCKKRIYPRTDPVVIMLVIDKENDCVLLNRQSRFVPRMWSCLAGFIEPGESLEEAVRRETLEETGIEVGEVVYHSSQPWPVGPSSMPCQLMVGFFAYAKSLQIMVDKNELEDAQWHSREDVTRALSFSEYERAQRTSAFKVSQMCKGVEKSQNLTSDLINESSGEVGQMFVPGPFAIAHHLIASWVNNSLVELPSKQCSATSNL